MKTAQCNQTILNGILTTFLIFVLFSLNLSTCNAILITDHAVRQAAVDLYTEELMTETNGTGYMFSPGLITDNPDPLCDMVFTEPGFFYCDRCVDRGLDVSCNFLIRLQPVKQVRVTLGIHTESDLYEISVSDGTPEGYSVLDKSITECGHYVFKSSAGAIHIRFDSDSNITEKLRFGFNVEDLGESYDGTTGCFNSLEEPAQIVLPHDIASNINHGVCYWRVTNINRNKNHRIKTVGECPPGEDCPWNDLHMYDGMGENKIEIPYDQTLNTTGYMLQSPEFTMEYFGQPTTTEAVIMFV